MGKQTSETKLTKRRTVACVEMSTKHLYRRAFSELQLLELNKNGYKQDHSYHFITDGVLSQEEMDTQAKLTAKYLDDINKGK